MCKKGRIRHLNLEGSRILKGVAEVYWTVHHCGKPDTTPT